LRDAGHKRLVELIKHGEEPPHYFGEMNKKTSEFGLYLSAIVSILFSVLIFMLLPGLMVMA